MYKIIEQKDLQINTPAGGLQDLTTKLLKMQELFWQIAADIQTVSS